MILSKQHPFSCMIAVMELALIVLHPSECGVQLYVRETVMTPVRRAKQERQATRTERLSLRAPGRQLSLIKRAAVERGQNVTEFVIQSAYSEAQQTLADRQNFTLSQQDWDAFMTALEQPPRIIPRLKRLFTEPSILETHQPE